MAEIHDQFDTILIVDFGSQFSYLITRKCRKLNVYAELMPCTQKVKELGWKPKGVILSAAPYSVYDIDSPHVDPDVFELGVPILGICYGLQEIAWNLGGKVAKCDYREYGSAHMRVNKFATGGSPPTVNALFEGLGDEMKVWMLHSDQLSAPPPGFHVIAHTKSVPFAAIAHNTKPLYGIQFHPEMAQCPRGNGVITRFVLNICGCKNDWTVERELVLQLTVPLVEPEVESDNPHDIERGSPSSLAQEFPQGAKVFFLDEHAYGIAACVATATTDTLSFGLAFSRSGELENEALKQVVTKRTATQYFPVLQVSEMLAMSKRALSRVTSSFTVLVADEQKVNLGLSIKFEDKSLKVINYSNKNGDVWEFSDLAIELIRDYKERYPELFRILDWGGDDMAKASTIFPSEDDPGAKAKEILTWLVYKGVRDFEPVPLQCDQLDKTVVKKIEELADGFTKERSSDNFKCAMVKNVPRRAVVKPEHAVHRLQNQRFDLGDRVVMVQESGGVPLAAKGVVIGLSTKTIDVVWDVPFISGTTLNNRCSHYRGSSVDFNACLNLTNRQFVPSVDPPPPATNTHPRSRFDSQPSGSGPGWYRAPSEGRGAPRGGSSWAPVHIMTVPNRGRGDVHVNRHSPAPGPSRPNGTEGHASVSSTDDQDSSHDALSRGWGDGQNRQEYRRPPVPPRGGYLSRRGFAPRGGLRG